MKNSHFAET